MSSGKVKPSQLLNMWFLKTFDDTNVDVEIAMITNYHNFLRFSFVD